MRIDRKLGELCNAGLDCPRTYLLEGGDTVLVQGTQVTDSEPCRALSLLPTEAAVELPRELYLQSVEALGERSWQASPQQRLHHLHPGVLMVVGERLTDPDLLRLLCMPPEETAVLIPASALCQVLPEAKEASRCP